MLLLLMSLAVQSVLDLVASIRSSPVDCCGCAIVLHVGGTSMLSFRLTRAMLFCAMRIFTEGRWHQTSKYDVSRWGDSGRGEIKVFCAPIRESNRQPLAYEMRMVPQDHCQCTPSPDYKVVSKGLGITCWPPSLLDLIEIGYLKASYDTFDDQWHITLICM
jgi:hypothetical protein